jgi:hypothetical protein
MKPILYHDIDGVLFGDYAGEFQLLPGLKTWLNQMGERTLRSGVSYHVET